MKYLSIIKYVLMAVSFLVVILGGFVSVNVDLMLRWTYIMLMLAIACVVLLPLINLAQNPKGALGSLVGLGAVLVIFGISYAMASDVPVITPANVYDNVAELKITDAGLYMSYIALGLAVVAIFAGELRNFFK